MIPEYYNDSYKSGYYVEKLRLVNGSGRFNVEKDSDVTWTRAWLLSLLLLPCSCWISDPLSEPRMGNGKLKRLFVLGLGLTTLILGSILVWYPSPDLSAEQEIVHKIAELSEKLQHANTLNDQRKTDLQAISKQFTSLIKLVKEHQDQYEDNNSPLNKKLAEYTKQGYLSANFSQSYDLSLPSVTAFLPNTVNFPNAFNPAFKISRNRAHVSVVLGIPTVKRQYQSYLVTTLQSVLDNMNQDEMDDCLIIIFIAETDPDYVYQISSDIQKQFQKHLGKQFRLSDVC